MSVFDRLGPKPAAADLLGWKYLGVDGDPQQLRIGFQGRASFEDLGGYVHGGFLAAMLDEVMCSTVTAASGAESLGTMISMSVDFIRPAPPGPLTGEGGITLMGKNIAFVESRLLSGGQLVARATGSCRLISIENVRASAARRSA